MKFDIDKLSQALQKACPEVVFALLHGSAKDGTINTGSDLDIAVYVKDRPKLDLYQQIYEAVDSVIEQVEADVGILNNAEPIYRFEALKGRLLFNRDMEEYLNFCSLTCREYENQIADYERQHKYRFDNSLENSTKLTNLSEDEQQALHDLTGIFRKRFGAVDVRLYGSAARDDMDESSDIDIFIVLPEINWQIEKDIISLCFDAELKCGRVFSAVCYSVDDIQNSPLKESPLVLNVREQGRSL